MNSQIAKSKTGLHIYTVSEITRDIALILENTFGEVWVEAEVSNFKAYPSGHFYFTLKDAQALLAAVMFSNVNKGLKFRLENGIKVICFGRIDVYAPRGQYQLVVEKIEPQGIGAQQLAFEQLKKKLFKEGLFDEGHKKPLPLMPFRLGIVTSIAGAAVRDILQILKKGSPGVDVLIRSVRVQGEGAAREIASAIEDFNQYQKVDTIIISRGGGSAEDLWAFNEEVVARAIYHSQIPTISAVGHQIDQTLADLVADIFVETPSAAAKVIVDKKNTLLVEIDSLKHNLDSALLELIYRLNRNLAALKGMLKSPLDRLLEKQQLLDELAAGLNAHIQHCLDIGRERFSALAEKLEALSPLAILGRGYSLTMLMPQGAIVKDARKIKRGDLIKTILGRGAIFSAVQEVSEDDQRKAAI